MAPATKRSAKQVASAYFEAMAARDLDAMVEQWSPGGVDHFYGMTDVTAPDGVRSFFGEMFSAIPDASISVLDMVAYGERAAVRWAASGSFNGTGKFQGLAPTGAFVEIEGLDLFTIRDGLIQENFAYTNATELARQMGAAPPAGSIGEKAMLGAVNARTAAMGALKRAAGR
jgi:steroid delta-isomerase-like uncharacterized protein